jgi:TPR repeat protein
METVGYRLVTDQNYDDDIISLARCLAEGIDTAIDITSALSLYRKAANRGIPETQFQRGILLRSEKVSVPNHRDTRHLLELDADAGYRLAASHYEQLLETHDDISEAVHYYRMSSDTACRFGMFNLADMFHDGKHIPQDIREAIRLYKLAADAGLSEVLFAVCELYRYGEGSFPAEDIDIERDHDRAMALFRKVPSAAK